jgi:NAD-dependent DNA ligase
MKTLENQVMAHRYLYYVLSDTVLSDAVYDLLEREARAVCPPESPVHGLGSSLPSDYSEEVKSIANGLLPCW